MKVAHIEARLKNTFLLPEKFIEGLPHKVAVFTTIQFMNSLEPIMKQIEATGRETVVFKTGHTRHQGQILGCNVQKFKEYANEEFDDFVYVGDGFFHPKALLWKNEDKKVHYYNPFSGHYSTVDYSEMLGIKKKYTASIAKFYMSNKIGVLISTKPGQFMIKRAYELEEEYPDKEFYFFIDNTLDFNALEDFNFIQCWINTACPRIAFDDSIKITKPVVNMEDIKKERAKRALIR